MHCSCPLKRIKTAAQFCAAAFSLFAINARAILPKQQGDAPQTCQSNNAVNDPAENSTLTAEDPGYQVKLEKTHKAPVDRTDNRKDQRNSIHSNTSIHFTGYWYFLHSTDFYAQNFGLQNPCVLAIIRKKWRFGL